MITLDMMLYIKLSFAVIEVDLHSKLPTRITQHVLNAQLQHILPLGSTTLVTNCDFILDSLDGTEEERTDPHIMESRGDPRSVHNTSGYALSICVKAPVSHPRPTSTYKCETTSTCSCVTNKLGNHLPTFEVMYLATIYLHLK